MLHRLLFVAGMTVGVTTPLVWAAYVARPAPHAAPTPAVTLAKAAPKTAKVTQAKPGAAAQTNAPAHNKPTRSHLKLAHVAQPPRAEPRYRPAVVDSYNGAHIIIVCAALTENEQLRAGCP